MVPEESRPCLACCRASDRGRPFSPIKKAPPQERSGAKVQAGKPVPMGGTVAGKWFHGTPIGASTNNGRCGGIKGQTRLGAKEKAPSQGQGLDQVEEKFLMRNVHNIILS